MLGKDETDPEWSASSFPALFRRIEREQGERVFILQDFPLFAGTDISIAFRGLNRAMPKYRLDNTDIHVLLQKGFGKCMPEHVWSNMCCGGYLSCIFIDHVPDRLVGQMTAP